MRYPPPPAPSTLAKYGLSMNEWRALWQEQGGACGYCRQDVHERYVIDHAHVPGWKNMEPGERKKHVRGIIGVAENHWLLSRYMTTERARQCVSYLERHDARCLTN